MRTSISRRISLRPRDAPLAFELRGPFIALNDLLKLAGACDSGGSGKALVAQGQVQVDGRLELRKTCKIRAGQTVTVGALIIRVVSSGAQRTLG